MSNCLQLHRLILRYQGVTILTLVAGNNAVFYNIKSALAFLCIEVGMTIIYTLLVAGRLLIHRRQMEGLVSKEHLRTCGEVMTMVVESAAPSSILSIIFIISFALHSYICNLVFLAISHVQVSFKLLPKGARSNSRFLFRALRNFSFSFVLLRDTL